MASFATKNNSDSFLPNPNLGFLNMNVFSHKKKTTSIIIIIKHIVIENLLANFHQLCKVFVFYIILLHLILLSKSQMINY